MTEITIRRRCDCADCTCAQELEDYLTQMRDALWHRSLRPSERKRLAGLLRSTASRALNAQKAHELEPLFAGIESTGCVPHGLTWHFV